MRNALALLLIMFIPTPAWAIDICFWPVAVVINQPQSQVIVPTVGPPESYTGWYSGTPIITQPSMSSVPTYYSQPTYTSYPVYSSGSGQTCTGPGCSGGNCSNGSCASGACANGSCSSPGAFRPFGGFFRR